MDNSNFAYFDKFFTVGLGDISQRIGYDYIYSKGVQREIEKQKGPSLGNFY